VASEQLTLGTTQVAQIPSSVSLFHFDVHLLHLNLLYLLTALCSIQAVPQICIITQKTYYSAGPVLPLWAVQTAACSVVVLSSSVEGRCAKSFQWFMSSALLLQSLARSLMLSIQFLPSLPHMPMPWHHLFCFLKLTLHQFRLTNGFFMLSF